MCGYVRETWAVIVRDMRLEWAGHVNRPLGSGWSALPPAVVPAGSTASWILDQAEHSLTRGCPEKKRPIVKRCEPVIGSRHNYFLSFPFFLRGRHSWWPLTLATFHSWEKNAAHHFFIETRKILVVACLWVTSCNRPILDPFKFCMNFKKFSCISNFSKALPCNSKS